MKPLIPGIRTLVLTYGTKAFPLVDDQSLKAIKKPRNILQPHKVHRNGSVTEKHPGIKGLLLNTNDKHNEIKPGY